MTTKDEWICPTPYDTLPARIAKAFPDWDGCKTIKVAEVEKFIAWFEASPHFYHQDKCWHCVSAHARAFISGKWVKPHQEEDWDIFGRPYDLVDYFGCDMQTASLAYYYPGEPVKSDRITKAHVVAMLRHLAATGKVLWEVG